MRVKPILLVIGVLFFIGCKGPLERKYNPETFSDDLAKMRKNDQVIIKNIINTYSKNKDVDKIAGNETILIPSLTYEQLKTNHLKFFQKFKKYENVKLKDKLIDERNSLANDFRSKWAKHHDPKIFEDSTAIIWGKWITKDPAYQNHIKQVIIKNNFSKPLRLSGSILILNKKTNELKFLNFDDGNYLKLIRPGKSIALRITVSSPLNQYQYGKRVPVSSYGPDFSFQIADREYNLKSFAFLKVYGGRKLNKEAADTLNKISQSMEGKLRRIPSLVDSLFTPTVWPYDSNQVASLEMQILNRVKLRTLD